MDLVAEIQKIPIVTRSMCLSLFAVTMSVLAGVVGGYQVIYTRQLAISKFQIWRLYTSFFLGSGGINFIFDMAMLYRYANDLESGPYMAKSADFAYQLIWSGLSIIVLSIPMGSMLFFRPLLHCLGYISSALAPLGAQTSIFGVVTLPIKYTPYVMLGIELLFNGPHGVAQCLPGTLVGHIWWWGVWGTALGGQGGILTRYSRAPRWMANYFREAPSAPGSGPGAGRGANSGGGVTVVPPRRFANDPAPAAAATTSGHAWGTGRTLGR